MMVDDLEEALTKQTRRYEKYGQQHVLKHLQSLSQTEKVSFLDELKSIEVEKLSGFLSAAKEARQSHELPSGKTNIQPFSGKVGSIIGNDNFSSPCYNLGIRAIRQNSVATVLLAGGQGTRLGFDGPKGLYDIGLTSGKTLFCLIAERILKLIQLVEAEGSDKKATGPIRIPLYIMTSPMNDKITREYFEKNNYFGLASEDVIFFVQGVLPCLSADGAILMESPSKCAMAPDGNGGVYPAMEKNGILSDMETRGIQHIHAFAIDNALTKPADPTFVGYCISQKSDCGNKVLWKAGPHEKVGVIAEKDGKPCVVEYSDLSNEMAEMVNDDKKLVFGAANICNHYYTLSFLKDQILPNMGNLYHLAEKKIPVWNYEESALVKPSINNGIKLEAFIFDVFPFSSSMAILEVDRKSEFAPIKNAPGSPSDSPDVARRLLSGLAKRWLIEAGASLTGKEMSDSCEVVPLTSYGGEGLETFKGEMCVCPFSL